MKHDRAAVEEVGITHELQHRGYFGDVRRQCRHRGIGLTEIVHTCGRRLPRHHHEHSYFSVLLHGAYRERLGLHWEEHHLLDLFFHPPSFDHRDEVGNSGTHIFLIEVPRAWLDENWTDARLPEPGRVLSYPARWISIRLLAHSRGPVTGGEAGNLVTMVADKEDSSRSLVVESLTAELLSVATAKYRPETTRPGWMGQACDYLRTHYSEKIRLDDVANAVGVHPVHLARVFRQHLRQTPGDYLRNVRLEAALRMLIASDVRLADISAACGYADQSQLTRAFTSTIAVPPHRLRRHLF